MTGTFITIEGPEGCGKSTQIALLDEHLWGRGIKPVLTHEPGGTALGERIRELLLAPDGREMAPACELLLFEASRAQHVRDVICPALAAGRVVISDRFSASTYAYQGIALGLGEQAWANAEGVATGGLRPHLTVILDIDPAEGLRRKGTGLLPLDRIEARSLEFHQRVREGYLAYARAFADATKVVDGMQSIRAVQAAIVGVVDDLIHQSEP